MMMMMMMGDMLNRVLATLTFDDCFLATLNNWTACNIIYSCFTKKSGRTTEYDQQMQCWIYDVPGRSRECIPNHKAWGVNRGASLFHQIGNFADNQNCNLSTDREREREKTPDRSVAVTTEPVACPRRSCNDPAVYHVFPLTDARKGQCETCSDYHP